jgi:hypothetical protein
MSVIMALEEGQFLYNVSCVECRCEVRGRYGMASPVRYYTCDVHCPECFAAFAEFELGTLEVA